MKEKFYRFMQGRYGTDEFSKFLLGAGLVLAVISMFSRIRIFYWIFLLCLVYTYYRMFSKDHAKRYAENQKFLTLRNRWKFKWDNMKKMREQKKVYHIYHCPYCKQKIRIPKGKGTIIITCPKCKQEFGKRS